MSASDLEKALRGDAEKVAEGRFRIDAKRALERLRDHRLADPSHWVLELLRAATLWKASRVKVRTDADDVEVTVEGITVPQAVMKDLLGSALTPGTTPEGRRAQLLGLSVAGALGVGAKWIHVEARGAKVELIPPDSVTTRLEGTRDGLSVAVRKKLSLSVVTSLVRQAPEGRAILERCRHFDCPLVLNGRLVNKQTYWDEPHAEPMTKKLSGLTLTTALPAKTRALSEVTIDLLGVVVTRRQVRLPGAQVLAWVRGNALRTNASGTDVVDTDDQLKKAFEALEAESLAHLESQVRRLNEKDDEAVRERFVAQLLSTDTDARARAVLQKAKVLPGPAGERNAVADFQAEVDAGRPLHVAHTHHPAGTYPTPTLLYPAAWKKLLPKAKWVDVKEQVRRTEQAVENRARWEAQPIETPVLRDRDWVKTEAFEGAHLTGVVGLPRGTQTGAFIRLLSQGRLLQQGDVAALSPLRFEAVVDSTREIPLKQWHEVPSPKLWSLATERVEQAVEAGLLLALQNAPQDEAVLRHARDLLLRHVRRRSTSLPRALEAVKLFPQVSGEAVSLQSVRAMKQWLYITQPWPNALLDGTPVLVLMGDLLEILRAVDAKKLEHAQQRLFADQRLRDRLNGPWEHAVVKGGKVSTPILGPGIEGELAFLNGHGSQLELRLYRKGFLLETVSLQSRYGAVVAAVECGELTPEAGFTQARRDEAYQRVERLVRKSEEELMGVIVQSEAIQLQWPDTLRSHLLRYLSAELRPSNLSPRSLVANEAEAAPLFETSQGKRSLAQLRAIVARDGHLWVAPPVLPRDVPEELFIVCADKELSDRLATMLDARMVDATPELERARVRRSFRAQAPGSQSLDPQFSPQAEATVDGVRAVVGVRPSGERALVGVLVERRLFHTLQVPSRFPLSALVWLEDVDPGVSGLDDDQTYRVAAAVRGAEHALVAKALTTPREKDSLEVLLHALAYRFDVDADGDLGKRLAKAPLFECTDGERRSLEALSNGQAIHHARARLPIELPSGQPVVISDSHPVTFALSRFDKRVDVTDALRAEAEARAARAKLERVTAVAFDEAVRFRRRLVHFGMEGEVAVLPGREGQVVVLQDRRPLCTVGGVLPPPLAAIVNCDTLTPEMGHLGIVDDAEWERVRQGLLDTANALASEVAGEWPSLSEAERLRSRADVVRLAFWAAKRTKGHALEIPRLLQSTDEQPISIADLRTLAGRRREVEYADRAGTLLKETRWVWRPRGDELELAKTLGFALRDVSSKLAAADAVRARPKVATVRVNTGGAWREPITGKRIEGEVVLRAFPGGFLEVDLLKDLSRLEHYGTAHPVGALAQVNADTLAPNVDWTKAIRNRAFRAVLESVENALERLLARRLAEGPKDDAWRQFAQAGLGWKRSKSGPLAGVLSSLPLFEDLAGAPVTLGAVQAEQSKRRRVCVATLGHAPEDMLVLLGDERCLAMLEAAGAIAFDLTDELNQQVVLDETLKARRLASLSWAGDALVRLAVQSNALRGELALTVTCDAHCEVRLAKDGVGVSDWRGTAPSGVRGVLEVAELSVDDDWSRAQPTPRQDAAVRAAVDDLYALLARDAHGLAPAQRTVAAWHALSFCAAAGVKSAANLVRLTGTAAALAQACLFKTTEGQWVSLQALGEEVLTRGRVAVLERRLLRPDVGDALALEAEAFSAPWVSLLELVLGKASVDQVRDVATWRQRRAEDDPPDETPLGQGLALLRKEARLLRAGALGHLSPDDLQALKVTRGNGKTPLAYDAKRKVVLLDIGHAGLRRALEGFATRPERVYLVLAAVYGLVNRALEHVTDEHEVQLLLGMAQTLGANPELLAAAKPRG